MFRGVETFVQDIRYGFRLLRRSPGFAVTAVSIIALGIAATTAAFTLLDYVLLRPLPFADPDRLVSLLRNPALGRHSPHVRRRRPTSPTGATMAGSFESMGAHMRDPVPGQSLRAQ